MATKINRRVVVNGVQRWIHANTEQEYADKLMELMGHEEAPPSIRKSAHGFREYALNWFEVYARPNIETATAATYRRQLTLHLRTCIHKCKRLW